MKKWTTAATALLVVGGINWGLVSLFEFDLVAWLFGLDFGQTNAATRIVYGLVGLSALVVTARLGELGATSRSGARGRVGQRAAKA